MYKEKVNYVAGFMMDYRMDRFIVIDKAGKNFGPGIKMRLQPPGGKIKKIWNRGTMSKAFEAGDRIEYPEELQELPVTITNENPHEAMSREFEEETGVGIDKKRWQCFMIKEYQEAKLYFFATFVSPNELQYVFDKAQASAPNPEGPIKIVDLIDIFFDPHLFTFDTSVIVQFIKVEMLKGFFTKLDPEGVNSAYKN